MNDATHQMGAWITNDIKDIQIRAWHALQHPQDIFRTLSSILNGNQWGGGECTYWYMIRVFHSFFFYFLTSMVASFGCWVAGGKDDHPPWKEENTSQLNKELQKRFTGTWFTWAPPDFDESYTKWNCVAISAAVAMLVAFCAPLTSLRTEWQNGSGNNFKGAFYAFFQMQNRNGEYNSLGISHSVFVSTIIFMSSALLTIPFYNLVNKSFQDGSFPVSARIALISFCFVTTFLLAPMYYIKREVYPGPKLCYTRGICVYLAMLGGFVAQIILALTCLVILEWIVHKNVKGGLGDFENQGEFDPHHWQYGVIFSCFYVFAPASCGNETSTSCSDKVMDFLMVLWAYIMIIFKGLIYGIYLHGLWSYGPDAMMRTGKVKNEATIIKVDGMWAAGWVWVTSATLLVIVIFKLFLVWGKGVGVGVGMVHPHI